MNKRPIYDMFIKGTDHQNYCDTYLIASKHLLRRPKVLGHGVEPRKLMKELERILPMFFACEDYGRERRIVNESFDENQMQTQELFPAMDIESSTGIELLPAITDNIGESASRAHHAKDMIAHFSVLKKVDHPYTATLQMTKKTQKFIEEFIVHESVMKDLPDDTYFKKFNP